MSVQTIKQWLKQKDGIQQFHKPELMKDTLIRIEDDEIFTIGFPIYCGVSSINSEFETFTIIRASEDLIHVYYRLLTSDGDDEDGWNGSGSEGWCEINDVIIEFFGDEQIFSGFKKQPKKI